MMQTADAATLKVYKNESKSTLISGALSVVLHGLVYVAVLAVQYWSPVVQDNADSSPTVVEIQGHLQGDGLAAKPEVLKAALNSQPSSAPAVDSVSEKGVDSTLTQPAAQVGAGGTVSSVSGTGAFGVENGREASLEERYSLELRQLMEKYKKYPMMARKLGHQGRVVVKFTLNAKGEVLNLEIKERSSSELLNKASVDLVQSISGLKPFPEDLKKQAWNFEVPVDFKM